MAWVVPSHTLPTACSKCSRIYGTDLDLELARCFCRVPGNPWRQIPRGSRFSAGCLEFGVLERDPYSELHLPRSAVRIRAGTGQNPVLARRAESGRATAESRRTGVIQRSAGRAVQHAA